MATVLKTVIGASQSRVQIPAPPPLAGSLAGWLGLAAPPIAALIVAVAGVLTPGHDTITRTVSRLAEPGRPAAIEVGLAVYLVAFALLMLAVSTRPRGLLAVAGCALVVVASVHLDPTSTATTALHRLASGVAMLALAAAPFRFAAARARYSRAPPTSSTATSRATSAPQPCGALGSTRWRTTSFSYPPWPGCSGCTPRSSRPAGR